MSTWRDRGEPCPLDEEPTSMDKCQPCRFFRGASSRPGHRGFSRYNCNFPRDGSEIVREPVPRVFREGMT